MHKDIVSLVCRQNNHFNVTRFTNVNFIKSNNVMQTRPALLLCGIWRKKCSSLCMTQIYFYSMIDYYYYGIANIPITIVGFIINCLALYCLWRSNRGWKLSNTKRFLLALNLWDTFTCLVLVPTKCIFYMSTEYLDEKLPTIKYIVATNTWCSNFSNQSDEKIGTPSIGVPIFSSL